MTSRVLAFGDSFVEGVAATADHGWAQQLGATTSSDWTISGVGGDTTAKLLARAPDLPPQAYHTVLIEVGLNDSRYRPSLGGNEVSLQQFRDNLALLIAHFRPSAGRIGFLGITHVDERFTRPYKDDKYHTNEDAAIYDAALREACAANDVDYVPIPKLADTPGLLVADGLHPSDDGHRAIADAVDKYLQ